MGKQLSIYLDELEAKRLSELAQRECRRPVDQVRFMLRRSLGIFDEQVQSTDKTQNDAGRVRQDQVASAVL